MDNNLSLAERMKNYEKQSSCLRILNKNQPIIIRLDGNNFKRFTKGFKKPFDEVFRKAMYLTMLDLCKEVQNCVLGYTQSDEITLILINSNKKSDGWFGCKRDKMITLSAASTTKYFNRHFEALVNDYFNNLQELTKEDVLLKNSYLKSINHFAIFDSRAFNVPNKEEVINNLIFRQQDCIRNSINMVGRTYYSNRALFGKSTDDVIEMLKNEKNIIFDDFANYYKYGCIAKKEEKTFVCDYNNQEYNRKQWIVDLNNPIFVENKDFIEKIIDDFPINLK